MGMGRRAIFFMVSCFDGGKGRWSFRSEVFNSVSVGVMTEMFIEGEDGFNTVLIDQGKTGAMG